MEIWPEDGIHNYLKCRGSIEKAKGHYQVFIVATVCLECRLVYIEGIYTNLVVPNYEV